MPGMIWLLLINNHQFLVTCAKPCLNFVFGARKASDVTQTPYYLGQNKEILSVEIVMELSVAF